jgi:tetratricopeptide (TPR) repeat protein
MKRHGSALGFLAGVCVAVLLAAAPAFAQFGALQGRVVDETGAPVAGAEVKLLYTGDMAYTFTVKTDARGRWTRAGLSALSSGRWNISATKDGMAGYLAGVEVVGNASTEVPDIVIRKGAVAVPPTAAAEKERARVMAEQKKVLEDVNAALTANNFELAATKLIEATTKIENCSFCFSRLGDVYVKMGDQTKAEESYKTAIKFDEKAAEPWQGLAIVYNAQKKFDQAAEASAKAISLQGAGGGAGDATTAYNMGIILSNQRKMAEAKVQFERAVQLDPNMASAHYQLAMSLMNEGKMAEALASLEKSVALKPTGPDADMAKTLIPELKKMIK